MRLARFITASGVDLEVDLDVTLRTTDGGEKVAADCSPCDVVLVTVWRTELTPGKRPGVLVPAQVQVTERAVRTEADWKREVRARVGEQDQERPLLASHSKIRAAEEAERFAARSLLQFFSRLDRALTPTEEAESARCCAVLGRKARKVATDAVELPRAPREEPSIKVPRAVEHRVTRHHAASAERRGHFVVFEDAVVIHDDTRARGCRVAKATAMLLEDDLGVKVTVTATRIASREFTAAAKEYTVTHLVALGYDQVEIVWS